MIAPSMERDAGVRPGSGLPVDYQAAIKPFDQALPTRAAAIVIGAHRNRQRFGRFDQAQGYANIVEPFLQFAVHKAPLREKHGDQLVLITHRES